MEKQELIIDFKNGNLLTALKSLLSDDLLSKYLDVMTEKGTKTDAKTVIASNKELIDELNFLVSKKYNKITLSFEQVEEPKKEPKTKKKNNQEKPLGQN